MLKYFSEFHLRKIEQCLRPNVDYFMKDAAETSSEKYFIGIDADQHKLVLTHEANKKPLKLVYNSDRSLSFYSPTVGKWLQTSVVGLHGFLVQRSIEYASKFEPLIGSDESDGIVLRTVQRWDNLGSSLYIFKEWVETSSATFLVWTQCNLAVNGIKNKLIIIDFFYKIYLIFFF